MNAEDIRIVGRGRNQSSTISSSEHSRPSRLKLGLMLVRVRDSAWAVLCRAGSKAGRILHFRDRALHVTLHRNEEFCADWIEPAKFDMAIALCTYHAF
jgi:hypothetical protein